MLPKKVIEVSWENYGLMCERLYRKVENCSLKFDTIMAISRGGLPIGVYLSHRLDLPLFVISARLYDNYEKGQVIKVCPHVSGVGEVGKKILLVDEINATGATILAVGETIRKMFKPDFVKVVVLVHRSKMTKFHAVMECVIVDPTDDWYRFPYEPSVEPSKIEHIPVDMDGRYRKV
jgi:hypoxanthine phosphoribosyltransferase